MLRLKKLSDGWPGAGCHLATLDLPPIRPSNCPVTLIISLTVALELYEYGRSGRLTCAEHSGMVQFGKILRVGEDVPGPAWRRRSKATRRQLEGCPKCGAQKRADPFDNVCDSRRQFEDSVASILVLHILLQDLGCAVLVTKLPRYLVCQFRSQKHLVLSHWLRCRPVHCGRCIHLFQPRNLLVGA